MTTSFGDEYGSDGGGKCSTSGAWTRCARSAKLFQISAGYVPPTMGSPRNSVSIGVRRSGYPTQTAATSCGV